MSSSIFRYFIHADFDQKMELQVDMSDTLKGHWKELYSSRTVTKFDDLCDALPHALDEILCGSSNYRPLKPAKHRHFTSIVCHSHNPARPHLLGCSAVHLECLYFGKYGSLCLSPVKTSKVFGPKHCRTH